MTQDQLGSRVERLRRELELLYRSESGWDATAIDRVTGELAEAEFALAGIRSSHLAGIDAG